MPNAVSFSALCPTCHNEVSQDPHDRDEVKRLLREDQLHFYCNLCDHEWEPSDQELANVEYIVACEQNRLAGCFGGLDANQRGSGAGCR